MQTDWISIHEKSRLIDLPPGKYYIDIVGGWLIEEHGFLAKLTDIKTGKRVRIKRANWPSQYIDNWKRVKRYYDFEILEKGSYRLEFDNPETLVVKRSNLLFFSLFYGRVENSELSVIIVKK